MAQRLLRRRRPAFRRNAAHRPCVRNPLRRRRPRAARPAQAGEARYVVMFGVATRSHRVRVEQRARNRIALFPDASGHRPVTSTIAPTARRCAIPSRLRASSKPRARPAWLQRPRATPAPICATMSIGAPLRPLAGRMVRALWSSSTCRRPGWQWRAPRSLSRGLLRDYRRNFPRSFPTERRTRKRPPAPPRRSRARGRSNRACDGFAGGGAR